MDISIVIPLYNEEESLPELTEWIVKVLRNSGKSFEIIFVDDGSNDNSWTVIEELKKKYSDVVSGISFRRNYGKSAALQVGFQAANGDVVITMDADMQDSPDEIPQLYSMITEGKYDLVSGWKKKRYDPISKTLPSKFFNFTVRVFTGIKLHDFNCGLKAYRAKVVKSIEIYGEMHRYIPVIAKQAGFLRIGEKVVVHRPRKYGKTKFGFERFVNGYLDLLSVLFITRFGKKPMHLFGVLGTLMFLIGFAASAYIGFHKLWAVSHGIRIERITSNPYFYIALVAMIIGTQLFLTGFLGELISRSSSDRNYYQIEKEI
ncbi:MAG: glycosyltransferase family 2 protein [Bacteroidales bacterium]|jgi:glycosyltransferase involved in cell wall biosynthesis